MTKNTTCSACGTGYINHKILYSLSFLEETVGRYGDALFRIFFRKNSQKISILVEKVLFSVLAFLRILKFGNDKEKTITGRSKLIWEEAERRGIKMEQLILWGKPIEYYRAKINGTDFYFQSLPIPTHMPQEGYLWLDEKFVLFEKLSQNNIPAPRTKKATSWKETLSAFEEMQKPVIIKPNLGSRGRHTTTNIKTAEELRKAYDLVREITFSWVVQEHLEGSVCRATVINEKLVGFFKADPPQVTGDGEKSIEKLIKDKNASMPDRISKIEINEDILEYIKRMGYYLESILPKDKTINLSAKTGRLYGGNTEEMLPKVHPKMHSVFEKAGRLMQAPVLGFDLIILDPKEDPEKCHWGIIECNSLPFIDLHYFALEGPKINLAQNIWDFWNEKNIS